MREAIAAFGRGECFVECFLATPRHVETQCLADEFGNVRVISTRDCSLQRRNQKVVEEAPAPTITADQQRRIEEASIAILREADYVGAGTCEFLIDGDRVTFLEVNTRIQVEHTVTEEVSGVDLIAAMIAISAGARLGKSPEIRGHSFEFRINAEDVAENFSPAPGMITRIVWPTGPGVRVDSGYRAGDTVPAFYDSLIAKLIVTGESREVALHRARRAIADTVIEGVPTTLDFHRRIIQDPILSEDDGRAIYTGWIDAHYRHDSASTGRPAPELPPELHRIVVEVDGRRLTVVLPKETSAAWSDGVSASDDSNTTGPSLATSPEVVTSPMGGSVVRIVASEGDRIEAGDTVLILEAMKMERAVNAPHAGIVSDLRLTVGEQVLPNSPICRIAVQRER